MNDKGRPLRAVLVLSAYLVISVIVIYIVISQLTALEPGFEDFFQNTITYALAFGIPMSIFAGLSAYFRPGETLRLILCLITTVIMALYVYFVTGSISLGWDADTFTYTITKGGLIILILVAVALKGVYHVIEYFIEKEDEEEPEPITAEVEETTPVY